MTSYSKPKPLNQSQHILNVIRGSNPAPEHSAETTIYSPRNRSLAAMIVFLTAVLAIPFSVPVRAEDTKPADAAVQSGHIDKAAWVKTFAAANWFEIESSKIAMERSSSDEVKALAQMLIDDHSKALEKLGSILEKNGTPLPTKDLLPKQTEALELLKTADGKDFDKAYVALQLDTHIQAIKLVGTYAAEPDDPVLGAFAKEILPTLQVHLQHVTDAAPK